jgi:hypothetical protein
MKAMKALLAEKREALKTLRYEIKTLSENIKRDKLEAKVLRDYNKTQKAIARDMKKAERIAKLEAKLSALKTPPVGAAARKASKKPSAVTITKAA